MRAVGFPVLVAGSLLAASSHPSSSHYKPQSPLSRLNREASYSHIMDPRSGMPVPGVLSVVVLTETGTAGHALDDAFFVHGVAGTRAYLRPLPATEAFLL